MPNDDKSSVKTEFRSPEGLPGTPAGAPSPSSNASQSLPNAMSFNTSSLGGHNTTSNPPRPPSTDLSGGMVRGTKRSSDEPHDGNPNKQVC